MNRNLASALTITSTAVAALAFAAMASGNVYAGDIGFAGDITVDTTPFVSTRTRAEVIAEVTGQAAALHEASTEFAMQSTALPGGTSGYTREQAQAAYIRSRGEVNAFTSEDSGSFYLAQRAHRAGADLMLAGSPE